MDFAKRELEKYGWKEGTGLGKQSKGISVALKPALKFDRSGVGFSKSEEYTNNWWEILYNKASNNISVTTKDNSVKVNTKHQDAFDVTTKKSSRKPTRTMTSSEYSNFTKSSKLTDAGTVNLASSTFEESDINRINMPALTDEELFAACGGRTAHKGARHGLKQNGKLSRLEMQEKLLLKQLNRVTLSDEKEKKKKNIEKKLRKIDHHKNKNSTEDAMVVYPPTSPCLLNSTSPFKCNKKRKNERKNVSFNETVVEIQSQDCNEATANTDTDAASHMDEAEEPLSPIVIVRKLKIEEDANRNNNNNNNNQSDLDEGIDCTEYDIVKEESKWELHEKIRKENRRMKRKLKILRKLKEDDVPSENEELANNSEKTKWAKRKLFDTLDDYDSKRKRCIHEIPHTCKVIKAQRKLLKEQRLLQQNLDQVTNTFDNICKISYNKTE